MNKKTIRIAGWALGLSMAVAGIGVAVGANQAAKNEPIETKATATTGVYEKVTGNSLEVGADYIITYGTRALGNTTSSNRITNSSTTLTAGAATITNPDDSAVWTLGNRTVNVNSTPTTFWTFYNPAIKKYLLGHTSKAQASLGDVNDATACWSLSASNGTFDFTLKGSTRLLRNNEDYGWASYASSTGDALTLYKKTKTVSSVNVKTQPTKTTYKIGETFDPSGLVVTVTYSDSTSSDVAYSGANASKFDFTGFDSSSAADDQQITVKYTPVLDQFTCVTKVVVDIISVNPNAILVDTSGMTLTYSVGDTIDLTGLLVTIGYDDDSDNDIEITSNDDFLDKGFTLKLSGAPFDLETPLTTSHNSVDFVVYYGLLYDDSDSIVVSVANEAQLTLNDASTSSFWASGSNGYDVNRAGIVGSGSFYAAFEGKWYVNSGFQMNEPNKGSYIANTIPFGTIKSITIESSSENAGYFSMYYGTSSNPSSTKITASVSGNTYTYNFSGKNATYFKFAKDVTKGSTTLSSISILFTPNDSLDRTEASAYSDYYLDVTEGLCDDSGVTNGVSDVWDKLGGVYNLLSSSAKTTLKNKAIEVKGVADSTNIGNAMARYYWAVKNHPGNADFIQGGSDLFSLGAIVREDIASENNSLLITVVLMGGGLLAAGGITLVARKRGEEK